MMASSNLIKLMTCLVVTCLVLGIPLANATLPCVEIIQTTATCVEYLLLPGEAVPAPCCNGVTTVHDAAKTLEERQETCRCLKPILNAISGIKADALVNLPGDCGVDVPIKIGPDTNCDTIPY